MLCVKNIVMKSSPSRGTFDTLSVNGQAVSEHMYNKSMKKKWMLGFLGLVGFLGVPGIFTQDWKDLLWLLWFLWFIYFIPKKKT
jgi:hypothetical protein